jgi:sugar lactone lactonase YvrE
MLGDTGAMQVLATGFGLVESPRWHDGRLWFADWIAGEIRVLTDSGDTEVIVRHASLPLCFDFLPDGTLIIVSGPQRALLRADGGATLRTYRDLSALSPFGSNDIVVDGRGNAYVNTPNFDMAAGPPPGDTAPGLVMLAPADGGKAHVVAADLAFPNGMAVTPDNSTLIVAESYRNQLSAFEIHDDGALGGRRVFAHLGEDAPDGICIDAAGAVWYADVPHRRCVRVRYGGEVLNTVELDRGGFACMLGGPDGRTLYIVAAHWPGMQAMAGADWDGQVLSAPAPAPRAGWPGDAERFLGA